VSFVVKKNTDKKTDFTAENAKIAGEFTTKSTKDHEGKGYTRPFFRVSDPFVLFVSFVV